MQLTKLTSHQEFEKYRQSLKRDCKQALCHWEVYKQIYNLAHTNNEAINVSPGFFQITRVGHLDLTVIYLAKLTDKRDKRHLSIYNFMKYVENNLEIFTKCASQNIQRRLEQDLRKLSQFNLVIKYLKKRRDYEIAHTNMKRVKSGFPRMPPAPKIKEVDDLIKLLDRILNFYSNCFDGNSYIIAPLNMLDLKESIYMIERGMASQFGE